ncbi:MAG: hypothetical protein LUH18_09310 [Oscillospiraceae bacterium]|nr:hypothetical protein [Oscillospiraceae bacterium]
MSKYRYNYPEVTTPEELASDANCIMLEYKSYFIGIGYVCTEGYYNVGIYEFAEDETFEKDRMECRIERQTVMPVNFSTSGQAAKSAINLIEDAERFMQED